MTEHYFKWSRDFRESARLCGECHLTYEQGEHIEITTLEPYTSYVCPVDTGHGHSAMFTGAYRPELRSLTDHLCICGAVFVKEDRQQWQLSWEMRDESGRWYPVERIGSHHSTWVQWNGLNELESSGEDVRNVRLVRMNHAP
jgi:hypothetical protein